MLQTIKKAPLLFASATFFSSVAMAADVTMSIDPIKNCLDTSKSTFVASGGGVSSVAVPAGTYSVYLSSNTMICNFGASNCKIDRVVVRGWPSSPGNWGFTASTNPTTVVVTSDATFAGFIVDAPCDDNRGAAIVTFKKSL